MDEKNRAGLVGILNSEDPHETPRRDIIRVALVPFSDHVPIGVYFIGMYGAQDMKFIPRSAIPEKFRKELFVGDMYVVTGNLMTRYAKDIRFTEFEIAPEPDPQDRLG